MCKMWGIRVYMLMVKKIISIIYYLFDKYIFRLLILGLDVLILGLNVGN